MPQKQPIYTIVDPIFKQLLNEATITGRGVPVRIQDSTVGYIVSEREYEQIRRQREAALQNLANVQQEMQAACADLSDEEIQRLVDEAVAEVRTTRKVAILSHVDEDEEDHKFFDLLNSLQQKTAHRSPDEQQRLADEMDDAILAEREKERAKRRITKAVMENSLTEDTPDAAISSLQQERD